MRVSFYKLPDERSLLDTTNLAVGAAYYYPADAGLAGENYKDYSITGKMICGADNTLSIEVQGTNDEDATPANRDWKVCYGYDTGNNAVVNVFNCAASTTVVFAFDLDNWNYKYFRVHVTVTNAGVLSNTVIIKLRRKSL